MFTWLRRLFVGEELDFVAQIQAHGDPFAPFATAVRRHLDTGAPAEFRVVDIDTGIAMISSTETYVDLSPEPHHPDQLALSLARGRVLDVAAGSGRHSLELQGRGHDVTALEASPACAELIRERGVESVILADARRFSEQSYDTVLLLQGGAGLAGTTYRLRRFLRESLRRLVAPGGQALLEAPATLNRPYMVIDGEVHTYDVASHTERLAFQWQEEVGPAFQWLWLTASKLAAMAQRQGWHVKQLTRHGGAVLLALTDGVAK